MKTRISWEGSWRNTTAVLGNNVARVQFSASRHYWLLKINDKIVSKHGSRGSAKAKGARLLKAPAK